LINGIRTIFLSDNQQVVVFSKRLADSFRSTPQKVQEMASIVLRELLLHPEDIIWIEKSFSPFDTQAVHDQPSV
jgi:hypothetical protein